jgi:hypothetical protein
MVFFMAGIYQVDKYPSSIFPQIREKKGKKGEIEAGGRGNFGEISPECINSAQYITIIIYKDE